MTAKNLSQLRPRLKPHRVSKTGAYLVVEDPAAGRQASIAAAQASVLELCDGSRTVKELVEALMASSGTVSFRRLFATLTTLDEAQLFTEPLGLKATQTGSAVAPQRDEAFFMRPLLEVTVLPRLGLPFLDQLVLLLAAAAVIAGLAFDTIYYWLDHFSTRSFFLLHAPDGHLSYARALPALVAMASGLMLLKGLSRALLLLLGTGQLYNLRLRLHAFGVSLGVSDISTHMMSRTKLVLYFIGTTLTYVSVAAVFPSYVHDPYLVRTFETLAVLLTLLELDPYRKSDLTLLIDRFFRDGDARRMTAYLKNRALFSAAAAGKGFGGEARLVAYSSLALLWTVGFALFALDLLTSNYPNLVLALTAPGEPAERLSAGVLLVALLAVFGTLFLDLASTIATNVVFPLLTPYLRLSQKLNAREVEGFNVADMVDRLSRIDFFGDLAREQLTEMVKGARVKAFRRGTRLIIQGEPGQELFVLLDGAVGVLKRDETGLQSRICQLAAGSVFGEVALVRDCTRTADVVADEHIRALIVDKAAFRRLVESSPARADFDRILAKIALGHYLSSVPLFREMPAETLGVFRELGRFEPHKPGDVVITEGADDRAFYLALRGQFEISKAGKTVALLKQGDFFGEVALLANVARTATVTCAEEGLLLKLDADAFWRVLSENLALATGLELIAEQRQSAGAGT